MAKTVVALYDNFNDAQSAVQDLINGGFRRDDLSLVANDEARTNASGDAASSVNPATSAGEGAGIGAALGGIAGLLVGLGALAIPGIGPVLAAGPIAAALAGMGIGAVTGGLIGALMDAGVPENEARYYAEGVRRGGTLVTVRSSDDMLQRATDILNQHHPADIHQRATQWQGAGWTGYSDQASHETRTTTGDFTAFDEDFRRNYQRAYANMGYNYDQYQPAYRYGFDLAHSENYEGRAWNDIEGQARSDWEQRHPDTNWDQFKDAVHYGWEHATGQGESDANMRPSGPTQGGQTYDRGRTGPAEGDWQQHPTENMDQLPQSETSRPAGVEHRPASETYDQYRTVNTPQEQASLESYEQGGQTTDEDRPYNQGQQHTQSGDMTAGTLSEDQRYGMQQKMEQGDPFAESPRLRQDDAAQQGEPHANETMAPDDQFSDAGLGADINQDRGPAGGYTSETRGGQAYNRDVEAGMTGHPERDLSENRGGEDFERYQRDTSEGPILSAGDSAATGVSPSAAGAIRGGETGSSLPASSDYDYDTRFRGHYDTNYASTGQSFDHFAPAYQYGYHMASDQRYRGQDWNHVEMQARQDWERDNPNSPWDQVKAAVRHAWESATGGNQGGTGF